MKEKLIMAVCLATIVACPMGLVTFSPLLPEVLLPAAAGVALLELCLFLSGLTTIEEEERAVVTVLGAFSHVAGPGLIWVCPGFMRIRAIIGTWEQSMPLFSQDIWIDFKDGRAQPKLAQVFVRCLNPDVAYSVPESAGGKALPGAYRMIYLVNDWRAKAVELAENAVRSFFAGLEVDEALEGGKGGFNLLDGDRLPDAEREKLALVLKGWGLEAPRILIGDFNLPKEVMEVRDAVQEAVWKAEASKAEIQQTANETTGTLISMMAGLTGEAPECVQARFKGSDELKAIGLKFSQDLVVRQVSLRHKALTDLRVDTGSEIGDLAGLVSGLFSRRQGPNPQPGNPLPTRNANPNQPPAVI